MRGHRLVSLGGVLMAASVAHAVPRTLPFGERLDAMWEIERVLDAERSATAGGRPRAAFEVRVPKASLVPRIERLLRRSAALDVAGTPITGAALHGEVGRMVAETQDPELLRRLFDALGNDPFLIAECLGREALAGATEPLQGVLPAGWREPAIDVSAWPAVGSGARGARFPAEGPPEGRMMHTAVWTGSQLLIWGGVGYNEPLASRSFRYDAAIDRFLPMAPGPAPRVGHTAVWTGSEMVVWGGRDGVFAGTDFDDGARYDPGTDAWTPTSTGAGTPRPRRAHTAVWTGSEMIVWGGRDRYAAGTFFGDGAAYDPSTDRWRPLPTGLVFGRQRHSAVFTGAEMIVWGGGTDYTSFGDGARYRVATNTWAPMTSAGAPGAMQGHAGFWTGSEMIAWGGAGAAGRYDTTTDSWLPVSAVGAPGPCPAAWTGLEMIAWPGDGQAGGRYDPAADAWTPMATAAMPSPRGGFTVSWSGTSAIVWGGGHIYWGSFPNTGGRYSPATDSWLPTNAGRFVPAGGGAPTVWTGAEMVVWRGPEPGGRYVPATGTWYPMALASAPGARHEHSAVWTGAEVVVWGGYGDSFLALDTGGRYDPATDSWLAVQTAGAPSGRRGHSVVWTGSRMIVWGGDALVPGYLGDGGLYDPALDMWTPLPAGAGSPAPRGFHSASWTGALMVVWGGAGIGSSFLSDGGRYDPATGGWSPTSSAQAPDGRYSHVCVWTGARMIVWGGFGSGGYLPTGGRYDPSGDVWTPTTLASVPSGRLRVSAVWTGSKMIVWGGDSTGTGGRYDPAADTWSATSTLHAPAPRGGHAGAFAGYRMLVWGGAYPGSPAIAYNDGRSYDPARDTWSTGPGQLVAGKARGTVAPEAIQAYRADGSVALAILDCFPGLSGEGVRPAAGDVEAGEDDEILAGPGPGAANPPQVRGFDAAGVPLPGLDFHPYAASGYGCSVGAGTIDFSAKILTGPGPSPVYGPHVRGFRYASSAVFPLAKVTFFAYGTLRFGVNPAAGSLDADGFDEIVTGAGAGEVFGPHVRGFDYDAIAVTAMPKVSFFAYQTPRYGVEVAAGDVDGDGFAEILTGPGPSAHFAAQLRGFQYDGAALSAIARINAVPWSGARYGLNPAAGDIDEDGYAEIACGPGPDPGFGSRLAAFDFDGATLRPVPALDLDVFGVNYGLRVAAGALGL